MGGTLLPGGGFATESEGEGGLMGHRLLPSFRQAFLRAVADIPRALAACTRRR